MHGIAPCRHVQEWTYAQDKRHWDMVTQQHSWTEEEKATTLNQIMGDWAWFPPQQLQFKWF
jgi:hypothetical protein